MLELVQLFAVFNLVFPKIVKMSSADYDHFIS